LVLVFASLLIVSDMTRTRSNGAAWAMNVGATIPKADAAKQEPSLIREDIATTDSTRGFGKGRMKIIAIIFCSTNNINLGLQG
jgi:hypothetical protein